jgi:hypothetical protein
MKLSTCLVTALVAGFAPVASAQLLSTVRPTAEYIPSHGTPGAGDSITVSDGFETYAPGAINGQGGYTVFAANATAPVVSAANPAGGAQHLRITKGLGANTSLNGAFTQDFGNFTFKDSIVSVDVNLSSTAGASAQIIAQAPGQALLTWRVIFDLGGSIFALDDADGVPGGALAFVNTGDTWTPGVYKNFRVELSTASNSLKYYYDGALIYTGSVGVFAANAVEQVILGSDNAYSVGQTLDFDNLNIVPAPGVASLFAAAGLVGMRRRRR